MAPDWQKLAVKYADHPAVCVRLVFEVCGWSNSLVVMTKLLVLLQGVRKQNPIVSQVLIAEVDCTTQRALCREQGVKGFPTILGFQRGQDPASYASGRTLAPLDRYVQQHLLTRSCNPTFDYDSDGVNDCGEKIQPNIVDAKQPGQVVSTDASPAAGVEGIKYLMALPYPTMREGKPRAAEFKEQVQRATAWWLSVKVDAVDLVSKGIKGVKKLGESLSIAVPLIIYADSAKVGQRHKPLLPSWWHRTIDNTPYHCTNFC